jgi:hypothetical protein
VWGVPTARHDGFQQLEQLLRVYEVQVPRQVFKVKSTHGGKHHSAFLKLKPGPWRLQELLSVSK